MGAPKSPEHRAKLSEAARRRWADPAARAALSEKLRRIWANPAARAARSQLLMGHPVSEATREKIRAHHRQPEARAAASARSKAQWAAYREGAPVKRYLRSNPWTYTHRRAWEQANGRRLQPGEVVHHIDGDRHNNEPSNLVAMSFREHACLPRRKIVGQP